MSFTDDLEIPSPKQLLSTSPDKLNPLLRQLIHRGLNTNDFQNSRSSTEMSTVLSAKTHEQQEIIRYLLQRLLNDRDHNRVGFTPKQLQVDVLLRLVVAKEDTILVAPTGFGKSLVFQAWSMLSGLLSIIIVPLLGLTDQVAADVQAIPGMKPIVVTSETKGQSDNIYNKIRHGSYTHVIMSPEQLLAPGFLELLRDPEFSMSIGALIIDEAHCVAMWSSFRSEYARIASVRPLLPANAVLFACTATMDANIEKRIVEDCGFGWYREWNPAVSVIRASVDRPDIGIIFSSLPRDNDLQGLLFTLRPAVESIGPQNPSAAIQKLPLKLSVIFANTRTEVSNICGYLRHVLRHHGYPEHTVRATIKTYTSRTAKRDRLIRVANMKDPNSTLRILVATSAFGMGLDVPDIELGVQYKAMFPENFTPNAMNMIVVDLMQRIGRIARGSSRTGMFVILTEHDVAQKEQARYERWRKKQAKLQPKSTPVNVPRSRRGSGTVSSRRNSLGVDPSGMSNEELDIAAGPLNSETSDFEGIAAAFPTLSPEEEQANGVASQAAAALFFKWSGVVKRGCKRQYLLKLLGNYRCRPELQTESVSPMKCCNHCNNSLLDTGWICELAPASSKARIPSKNTPAYVALSYVRRWAETEAIRRRTVSEHDLFDIPTTVFIPEQIQLRLSQSIMHIEGIGIMLANTGSDYYATILQDLDTYNSKSQEMTALKERFHTFMAVEHKSALCAEITNLKKEKSEQRLQRPAIAPSNQTTQPTSQQPENNPSRVLDVAVQSQSGYDNEAFQPSQYQSQNVSTETQSLCIGVLRSQIQQPGVTPVYGSSRPSGLQYSMVLTNRRRVSSFYTTPFDEVSSISNNHTLSYPTLHPHRIDPPSLPSSPSSRQLLQPHVQIPYHTAHNGSLPHSQQLSNAHNATQSVAQRLPHVNSTSIQETPRTRNTARIAIQSVSKPSPTARIAIQSVSKPSPMAPNGSQSAFQEPLMASNGSQSAFQESPMAPNGCQSAPQEHSNTIQPQGMRKSTRARVLARRAAEAKEALEMKQQQQHTRSMQAGGNKRKRSNTGLRVRTAASKSPVKQRAKQ